MRKPLIAASLICSNPLDILSDLRELNISNVDFIHFDVMDGHFVPRYGLYPEILTKLKEYTGIPVDVHMMVSNPEEYIDVFAKAGATYFNVHYEACPQLHRTIKRIKDAGMKAGVALNYHTPVELLKYVLGDIDMVVLMAINPGIVGHEVIPGIYSKIRETRAFLDNALSQYTQDPPLIQIDGGVTPITAPLMMGAGADILVCGTGTIYRPQENTLTGKISEFRKLFEHE